MKNLDYTRRYRIIGDNLDQYKEVLTNTKQSCPIRDDLGDKKLSRSKRDEEDKNE